jgi:hypothetical protein
MSRARELDQFYTSRPVAKHCFSTLLTQLKKGQGYLFLEPSAGDGAFYDLLPADSRIGLDLDPKTEGVAREDFFNFAAQPDWAPVVTVGNPPFGRNTSLAVRFFNHAAEFSELIAFVIPLSFRKESLQRRLNTNFVLTHDETLPPASFVFEGKPYCVLCCFQIWVRSDTPRVAPQGALTHPDFRFTTPEFGDFAFRRVGRLAGKVLRSCAGCHPPSHYFIQSNICLELLMARMTSVDWAIP